MHRFTTRPVSSFLLVGVIAATASLAPGTGTATATEHPATPAAASCATATPGAGMGAMAMGSPMAGMDMGTPMPGMAMEMEFDQQYIDMMMPHHQAIIAMSQAALGRLEDERLRTIAQNIIDAQSAEMEELRGYRERFYGDPAPMSMDEQMMGMMDQMMPGMGSMAEMATQMDPAAQVAAICAAADADLAFIELTIAHHEMAITASEAALDQAVNDEIRAFAERVIEDQQGEIDELGAIREDLSGAATPAA